MFNKINFKNLLKRGSISSKLLPTDYIGVMKYNEKANGGFEQSVISSKDLISEVAKEIPSGGGGGGVAPTTAVIDISAANFAASGTTPVVLAAVTADGIYYDKWRARVEYTAGATDAFDADFVFVGEYGGVNIGQGTIIANAVWSGIGRSSFIAQSGSDVRTENATNGGVNASHALMEAGGTLTSQIVLTCLNNVANRVNPTDGGSATGTFKVFLEYTTATFGE